LNWGAPLAQPDHARLAMECVVAMATRMGQLRSKWEAEGVVPFAIRGGLHSGEVVAGNVGFAGKKMEYTVIGDTVNLASRLEGTAKYYGISYLVGEQTRMLAPDACAYRELDKIRVVGKQLPVTIYEPQVGPDALSSGQLARFQAGLAYYRQRDWTAAQSEFAAVLEERPEDRPSQLYVERCTYFAVNPPAEDWDGVFNRAEK